MTDVSDEEFARRMDELDRLNPAPLARLKARSFAPLTIQRGFHGWLLIEQKSNNALDDRQTMPDSHEAGKLPPQ